MGILVNGFHFYFFGSQTVKCLVLTIEVIAVTVLAVFLAGYAKTLPSLFFNNNAELHCPLGYTLFNATNHCYKSHVAVLRHIRARKVCLNEHAELTSIHSEEENDFIIDLTRAAFPIGKEQKSKQRISIGLLYYHEEWRWFDGSEISYTNFMKDMPFILDNEMYTSIVMESNNETNPMGKQWKTELSYHKNYFVCKMKPVPVPN